MKGKGEKMEIKKVAVLGAGVMGSGIAAHMANAGIPCLLLDIVLEDDKSSKDPAARNRLSIGGKTKALGAKPAAFYSPKDAPLITVGNFEDDLGRLPEYDWIIEVILESLKPKQDLFARVEKARRPGSIVTSNTSGIPIKGMTEGRSKEFKEHFLVTHFFNPVRYMRLLEIISGTETKKEIVDLMTQIGQDVLGKGVVFGKDTPNFVANRIGVFSMMLAIKTMLAEGYTIEEVDAIAGPPMGRPKSAAFRTADMVGLDTLVHVAKNVYDTLPNDECRDVFAIPDFINEMVKKGLLGDKTKKGFYQKVGKDIQTLDYKTIEYRPQEKAKFESLSEVKSIEDTKERINALIEKDDRGAKFAWKVLAGTLIYAANRIPEIADDVVNIDNAMKWGFNWELGPFETWDAIGVKESCARMEKEGMKVPELVKKMLSKGKTSFYERKAGKTSYYDFATGKPKAIKEDKRSIVLLNIKEQKKVIAENTSATLIDIGDGVACLEFHTKMNAIDADIISMMKSSLEEVRKNFIGLVIGNQAENFSAGANIFLLLMEAENQNWDNIKNIVKEFQETNMAVKYFEKPVVAMPSGLVLGGGCEVCMSAGRMVANAESYIGLVEVGVGLIPGGGGTKEMLLRNMEGVADDVLTDPFPYLRKAFETIAMAKVATSAKEARELKFLRPSDRIVLNKDLLLNEAKNSVITMAKEGWKPPVPPKIKVTGEMGRATAKIQLNAMKLGGYISEHDELIASKLAYVLSGGNTSFGSAVSEEYLIELEREAFVSLCGYEKTRERMKQMLMTGRPLRN